MGNTIATRTGPLAGTRIVEFDAIGPVPFAAMILADFGCDIVRIGRKARPSNVSADGPVLGRGRRCIALDLKSPGDRDTALDLIRLADVVLEGGRPGVMERLGLGPDACLHANQALVYGRMTGWGQTGPLAQTAGHDINYIALTGVLHAIGGVDRPVPPLNLIGDYGGGAMLLALGVTSALVSARQTGQGQIVDAAMTDGSALLMSLVYMLHHAGHWRDRRESNLLDGSAPFYRTYVCGDGRHVAVGAIEPVFFAALLERLDIDASTIDQNDQRAWPQLERRIADRFLERSRDEWDAVFEGTDACVTPVLSLSEAPSHPHNHARSTFSDPYGITQPMPAPRFSATPATVALRHDTNAAEVLADWKVRL